MPFSVEQPPRTRAQIALRLIVVAITLGCAAAAGWMDLHGIDLEATLLFVAGTSFALAALVRGTGALGGVLIGLGVPLTHLYARAADLHPTIAWGHTSPGYYPVVAALGGLIVGLAVRTGFEQARR